MKALVTGIAGFTGRYIAQALNNRGIEVVGVGHDQRALPYCENLHVADITNADAIHRIVRNERPDYVVHLAAISFVLHGDVEEIYRTNILGTRHLLAALAELDEPPRAVLLASSSNVYGNRHEGIMSEDSAPEPVNDYSVSKLTAELVAGLFRSQLPMIIARPFNYTGIGQSGEFLIPKLVRHVRSGERKIRLGNLDVARDFSDVRFVAEAYCRLLECPAAIGQIVNVSSGCAYTLSEILTMIAEIAGYALDVEIDPALVRDNEVKRLWGDSSRLDQLVGPVHRIGIAETLRWMISADR